jgi:hypothetical protein
VDFADAPYSSEISDGLCHLQQQFLYSTVLQVKNVEHVIQVATLGANTVPIQI